MDWYLGSGIDDLVVPKDGDLPDWFPSAENWFKWEMNAPQSFGSGNKYFTIDSELPHKELNFNGKRSSCYDDEVGASVSTKNCSLSSGIDGELSNSLQQSAASHCHPDYQLDDFPGIEQMDDIFLNSLLDDLPVIENFHKSVCISPRSQSDIKTNRSVSTRVVDSQSNLCSINSAKSSKYARTDSIYMPVGWENIKVTHCKSEQKDHPPVKALQVEHFSLSEENSTNGYVGEETPLEESILQELEIVMTQLTDKTRICFRDALYRLAKNSKQHLVDESQTDDPFMKEPHLWTACDETIRHERTEPVESETNTIDRAIANLMFGEMESNASNIPLAVSTNFNQEVTEASGQQHSYCWSQQGCNTLSGDAEVPVHLTNN